MTPPKPHILSCNDQTLHHVLDMVGGVIVALDTNGVVTLLNAEGCRLLGYAQEEILGKNWIDTIIPEEQRQRVRDVFQRIMSGEKESRSIRVEGEVLTKSGKRRLVAWANSVLEDDGKMVGSLSSGVDITEQRRAEEALKESTTWLTSIFSSLDDAMFILSPDRRIIDVNPAGEHLTGYSSEELVGNSMEMLHVDQEHYQDFERRVEDAIDRSETAMFVYTMRRKDGTVFPSEHSVTMLEREGGRPLGIVSLFRDITDRKQAEEDRQRVFNMSVDMLAVSGLDGIFREVNPSWERTLGWTDDELKTRPWIEYVHPQDQEAAQAALESLVQGESLSSFETRYLHKDGSYRWISWNSTPDMDQQTVFSVARDVTQRKLADQALTASEERFRMLMEQAPLSMELYDNDGVLIQCNEAWGKLWGVEHVEDLLLRYNVMDDPQAQRLGLSRAVEKAFMNGEPVDLPEIEFDREASHRTGRKRFIHSRIYPLRDDTGKIQYVVVMHEDISERKRLEEELKRLATTDSLTGTRNRHNFMQTAKRELGRARRYKRPLTALMIDIDHFKRINDTYGHQAGDSVLKAMVTACHEAIRESDVFGRLGGEEFALALTDTDLTVALEVAERLRVSLSELKVEAEGKLISFTVSMGLAALSDEHEGLEALLGRADKALYEAKNSGRNKVVVDTPEQ